MKALFSLFLALGVCIGSVEAGPVRTARNVAKSTAITAKNVAHSESCAHCGLHVHAIVEKPGVRDSGSAFAAVIRLSMR